METLIEIIACINLFLGGSLFCTVALDVIERQPPSWFRWVAMIFNIVAGSWSILT